MRVINNPTERISNNKTAVALGRFDGIHLAHKKLIKQTQKEEFASVVFAVERDSVRITSPIVKPRIMKALGIDIFASQELSSLKHMTAEAFFENYILDILNAGKVVVGFNYTFGKDKQGDVGLLWDLCGKAGIDLCIVPPFEVNGRVVSSTYIRKLITEGDLQIAEQFLGHPFAVCGEVVGGSKKGAANGFPTANIEISEGQIMPPFGVYASRCNVMGEMHDSITHYGVKPTVDVTEPTFETHILNFNKDIYGEEITIFLEERIREIKKFNCLKTLKNQINLDIEKIICKKMEKSTCQNFPIGI